MAFGANWYGRVIDARQAASTRPEAVCTRGLDCETKDLPAQIRSADASEALVDLNVFQLILGTFGTLLLGATFFFTAKATQAASAAAIAAEKSVDIARISAERQLRPYVLMDQLNFLPSANAQGSIDRWTICVAWRNTGQTPARNVIAKGNYCVIEGGNSPLPDDFSFPDADADRGASGARGPNQSFENRDIKIPTSELHRAFFGEATIYIWAWVEYDGFDDAPRHRTEYASKFEVRALPDSRLQCTDVFLDRFNGADGDCSFPAKTPNGGIGPPRPSRS